MSTDRRERYARAMHVEIDGDPYDDTPSKGLYLSMADAAVRIADAEIADARSLADAEMAEIEGESAEARAERDMWERRAYAENESGGEARLVISTIRRALGVAVEGDPWSVENMAAVRDAAASLAERLASAQEMAAMWKGLALKEAEDAASEARDEIERMRSKLESVTRTADTLRVWVADLDREKADLRAESDQRHAEYVSAVSDKWAEYDRAQGLLAENTRLSDENERLAADLEFVEDAAHWNSLTADEARREVDGLRHKVRGLQVENTLMRTTIAGLAHAYPQDGVTP